MVANRNRLRRAVLLLERAWGFDQPVDTGSVDARVGRLRAKLGPGRTASRP